MSSATMKAIAMTIAMSATLACGARPPKILPNDEVTSPLTIEDEDALDENERPLDTQNDTARDSEVEMATPESSTPAAGPETRP